LPLHEHCGAEHDQQHGGGGEHPATLAAPAGVARGREKPLFLADSGHDSPVERGRGERIVSKRYLAKPALQASHLCPSCAAGDALIQVCLHSARQPPGSARIQSLLHCLCRVLAVHHRHLHTSNKTINNKKYI
jgi:hypothetical protein